MFKSSVVLEFQEKIFSWYKNNKRELPWRRTDNPYHILVSEIMLQQTQVQRVIPYYQSFIKRFPDYKTLAGARKRTVLSYWSGLGYNLRALRLREAAHDIFRFYQSEMPRERDLLLSLPGVGRYTSAALLAFAYNIEAPVIDTNIRRVLIYELELPEDTSLEELEEAAALLVPKGKSREWNSALIDYGAVYATARKTKIKPQSRQSLFEGSERQIRGAVLRYLLENDAAKEEQLSEWYPHHNFSAIISKMTTEGLIKKDDEGYLYT